MSLNGCGSPACREPRLYTTDRRQNNSLRPSVDASGPRDATGPLSPGTDGPSSLGHQFHRTTRELLCAWCRSMHPVLMVNGISTVGDVHAIGIVYARRF